MKTVPDHRYPRGTRDIFVASLSNNTVSCGSVVPCVETSREKPTTGNELFREANELEAGCGSQNERHNKHGNDLFLTR